MSDTETTKVTRKEREERFVQARVIDKLTTWEALAKKCDITTGSAKQKDYKFRKENPELAKTLPKVSHATESVTEMVARLQAAADAAKDTSEEGENTPDEGGADASE